MLVEHGGQLEFGAHAVRGSYQHGGLHAADVRPEQTAEPPDVRQNAVRVRAGHQRLDAGHQLVAGIDIHPGVGVGLRT